jgi:hypothetical protein
VEVSIVDLIVVPGVVIAMIGLIISFAGAKKRPLKWRIAWILWLAAFLCIELFSAFDHSTFSEMTVFSVDKRTLLIVIWIFPVLMTIHVLDLGGRIVRLARRMYGHFYKSVYSIQ